jgi:hypothetical protein
MRSFFGYYEGEGQLVYVAQTRNGFTAASRDDLFRRFRSLETVKCPFVNLPEARGGRGAGIEFRSGPRRRFSVTARF